MSVDRLKRDAIDAAQKYKARYKQSLDPNDLDMFKRFMDVYNHLSDIEFDEIQDLQGVTDVGNVTTNTIDTAGTKSDYFLLDTTATPTLEPGMIGWNDAFGTADLRLKGDNVTLQVGQEIIARVVNKTGADLIESEYKVVRVRIASEGGAQGQRLAVVLAQGDNDPDSVTTLGIVTETILDNQEGFITILGNVSNIDTTGTLQGETWVDGDVLYLSPTTPGALTKVPPVSPQHTVTMGYVVYAHQNQGKIFVKVDNGYELDELHNVLITSPQQDQVLKYDAVSQVWVNGAGGGGATPTLDQVTTAGNTTTNAITVGGLTSNASSIILGAAAGTLGSKVLTLEGSLPELFFKDTFSTGSGFSLSKYGSAFYFVRTSSTGVFTNYAGAIVNNSWSLGHGGNPNATVHIKGADVLSSTKTLLVQNSSPTDLLTIWNDGAVGINTSTNAGYKLDVNGGNVNVSGDYYNGGTQGFTGQQSIGGYMFSFKGGIITGLAPTLSGAYDGYDSIVALSVSRLLYASYVGSAIRVRRSSDNAEQDIGFSGGELDEAALIAFASSGDAFVVTVYDQSGYGNNFTQINSAKQPKIVSAGSVIKINGKPALFFDGIDDGLASPNVNFGSPDICTLAVGQSSNVTGVRSVIDADDGSSPRIGQLIRFNGTTMESIGFTPGQAAFTDNNGTGAAFTQYLLFSFILSSFIELYTNNATNGQTSYPGNATGATGMGLGFRKAGTEVQQWDGHIQEVVIWNTDQFSNRITLQDIANSYYSIY